MGGKGEEAKGGRTPEPSEVRSPAEAGGDAVTESGPCALGRQTIQPTQKRVVNANFFSEFRMAIGAKAEQEARTAFGADSPLEGGLQHPLTKRLLAFPSSFLAPIGTRFNASRSR